MTGEITLIGAEYYLDETGKRKKRETKRTVLCEVSSPTRAEWGAAGQQGFKADYVMKTPDENYCEEEQAVYKNRLYSIYRTFYREETGEVELYLSRRQGYDVWDITPKTDGGGSV